MTDLARLDGPGAAAVSDQLVAVYRAAMGAAPFFETEVESGWFAEELAGEVEEAGYRCWVATEDDLDTPARALYRSLGFQELGHGTLGWHDADRVVLGAELPQPG